MIIRTLFILIVSISSLSAAKRVELQLKDILGYKMGKWEGSHTYTYPNQGTIVSQFESISYLSKNKKMVISKGTFKIGETEGAYTSKDSVQKSKDGTFKSVYEDNLGYTATGRLKIVTKSHLMRIEDLTGNVQEWTIEQVDENTFRTKGTCKKEDGTLIYSWVAEVKYLGE